LDTIVDLMEKSFSTGNTKLKSMDKMMDKPWKTKRVFSDNLTHILPTAFSKYHQVSKHFTTSSTITGNTKDASHFPDNRADIRIKH
jgi:hypothetical protein